MVCWVNTLVQGMVPGPINVWYVIDNEDQRVELGWAFLSQDEALKATRLLNAENFGDHRFQVHWDEMRVYRTADQWKAERQPPEDE